MRKKTTHPGFQHPYTDEPGDFGSLYQYRRYVAAKALRGRLPPGNHGYLSGLLWPPGKGIKDGTESPGLIDQLTSFRFGQYHITNFEMETSAIYGMGKVLGHQCLSLSAIVANRISKEFSKDGNAAVEQLIKKGLEIVCGM